jgi:hypothetical protein
VYRKPYTNTLSDTSAAYVGVCVASETTEMCLSYFGRCRVAINLGCQVLKEFLNSIKISKQLTEFWKNSHNFTKSLSGLKNSRKVRKL